MLNYARYAIEQLTKFVTSRGKQQPMPQVSRSSSAPLQRTNAPKGEQKANRESRRRVRANDLARRNDEETPLTPRKLSTDPRSNREIEAFFSSSKSTPLCVESSNLQRQTSASKTQDNDPQLLLRLKRPSVLYFQELTNDFNRTMLRLNKVKRRRINDPDGCRPTRQLASETAAFENARQERRQFKAQEVKSNTRNCCVRLGGRTRGSHWRRPFSGCPTPLWICSSLRRVSSAVSAGERRTR